MTQPNGRMSAEREQRYLQYVSDDALTMVNKSLLAHVLRELDAVRQERDELSKVVKAFNQSIITLTAERDLAREDQARMDWLNHEHCRVDPVAHLVVKLRHDRNGFEWGNVTNPRAEIDAIRAASGGPVAAVTEDRRQHVREIDEARSIPTRSKRA
jgi:hypothetical protein